MPAAIGKTPLLCRLPLRSKDNAVPQSLQRMRSRADRGCRSLAPSAVCERLAAGSVSRVRRCPPGNELVAVAASEEGIQMMVRTSWATSFSATRTACMLAVIVALALGVSACTSDPGPANSQASASASRGVSAAAPDASGSGTSSTPADQAGAKDTNSPDGSAESVVPTGAEAAPSAVASASLTGGVLEGAPATKAPSISLTDTGDLGGSVTATLSQVEPVRAAPIVGAPEQAAIEVTIEIDNGSAVPIGLDNVQVTLTDSAGNLAAAIDGGLATPFAGMMVPGGKAQATYLFAVPNDVRNPVTISVARPSSAPTLPFVGDVAVS